MRTTVQEASDLVVIDTVPSGQQITVDGIQRTTPFAAAIRCTASNPTEWPLGSLHRISAPAPFTVTDALDNQLLYRFASWSAGSGSEIVVAAHPNIADILGTCAVAEIIPADSPSPLSAPQEQSDSGFDIATALDGTPRGPFLRITEGTLTVNGLDSSNFSIHGELLAGFSELHARLSSDSLSIPETDPLFELGASLWKLDLNNSDFRLACHPTSVKVMGTNITPDGRFSIEMETGSETNLAATMSLDSDFRPAPNFIEFKKGEVSAALSGSEWSFRFNGGMRILRLPDELSGSTDPVWAIDTNTAFAVNGDIANFSVRLSDILLPDQSLTLVDSDPWFMAGDIIVSRTFGGPVSLTGEITTLKFSDNPVPITPLLGTVTTDGELRLTGTANSGTILNFGGSQGVFLENAGATASFALVFTSMPEPRLRLDLPSLVIKSNADDFPGNGIVVPAVSLDTSGAFDTGCIALPSFTFAGINVSSGGNLDDNYIRLRRNTAGHVVFYTRAEIPFLPDCDPGKFSLTLATDTLHASYRNQFCVLPEPITINYDSTATCPFSGSAFGFDIHFGAPSCTCVSAGGIKFLGTGSCE